MNLNSGGAQPIVHDGWFMHNGECISQPMIIPADHPTAPGKPKGVKLVLQECGLWRTGLQLEYQKPKQCSTDCCAWTILAKQPDFLAQNSSVQEVIEMLDICAFFSPNFTASWTSLNSSGVLWKDFYMSIVIVLLKASKLTLQKHLPQQCLSSAQHNSEVGTLYDKVDGCIQRW